MFRLSCATTSPPRERAASIAAGRIFTSMPSDTVSPAGAEVCTNTTSGGRAPASKTGTSESRLGKYLNRSRPRMPTPTNGDSSVTPSRSGIPGWAFSANSRYSSTDPSRTARACHGGAKLPPATTLGAGGRKASSEASLASATIRIMSSFRANGLPGRAPSASHGRRVIRGGLLAGNAKAAAVQYLRRNPDEVFPHPRGPRGETHLLQLADFRGIGHFPRLSDGGDAPPGPLVGVQAIDFERDD